MLLFFKIHLFLFHIFLLPFTYILTQRKDKMKLPTPKTFPRNHLSPVNIIQ